MPPSAANWATWQLGSRRPTINGNGELYAEVCVGGKQNNGRKLLSASRGKNNKTRPLLPQRERAVQWSTAAAFHALDLTMHWASIWPRPKLKPEMLMEFGQTGRRADRRARWQCALLFGGRKWKLKELG
ncbi:hypothetical protein ACLKA7_006215 [Drosophila subpalustris]